MNDTLSSQGAAAMSQSSPAYTQPPFATLPPIITPSLHTQQHTLQAQNCSAALPNLHAGADLQHQQQQQHQPGGGVGFSTQAGWTRVDRRLNTATARPTFLTSAAMKALPGAAGYHATAVDATQQSWPATAPVGVILGPSSQDVRDAEQEEEDRMQQRNAGPSAQSQVSGAFPAAMTRGIPQHADGAAVLPRQIATSVLKPRPQQQGGSVQHGGETLVPNPLSPMPQTMLGSVGPDTNHPLQHQLPHPHYQPQERLDQLSGYSRTVVGGASGNASAGRITTTPAAAMGQVGQWVQQRLTPNHPCSRATSVSWAPAWSDSSSVCDTSLTTQHLESIRLAPSHNGMCL